MLRPQSRPNLFLIALALTATLLPRGPIAFAADPERQDQTLYIASPLTTEGEFTPGIEGPAFDKAGSIFAVNFSREHTIGKTLASGKSEIFVTLPDKSTGNGIVFDKSGALFVADYVGHNVLRIHPETRVITVFAHSDRMNQPNDLAITPDGLKRHGKGTVVKLSPKGEVKREIPVLGAKPSNLCFGGPDGRTVYVTEVEHTRLVQFRVDRPGLAWKRHRE